MRRVEPYVPPPLTPKRVALDALGVAMIGVVIVAEALEARAARRRRERG